MRSKKSDTADVGGRAAGDIMFYDEAPGGGFIVGELPGLALGHVWERTP